ncbi:MAG: hypothetical protein L0216_09730 [Planctomycetales bacterium]|nr:hypothetical protein [Planctomycetales bacterium]
MDSPAVAAGGEAGSAIVAWMDQRSSGQGAEVWVSSSKKGAFPPEALLHGANEKDQTHPSLAIAGGAWHAVWTDARDREPAILGWSSDRKAEFRVSGSTDGTCDYARLATGGATVVATWEGRAAGASSKALFRRLR